LNKQYDEKTYKELRKKIIDQMFVQGWKDVWFYPSCEKCKENRWNQEKKPGEEREECQGFKIKGFLGTKDIIFLGLNPSYGAFPSDNDKFFYDCLSNRDFENAHITDLIKIRAKGKGSKHESIDKLHEDKRIVKEQVEFLKREIEIIEPKIIVTLGKECDKHFRKKFEERIEDPYETPHHSFKVYLFKLASGYVEVINIPHYSSRKTKNYKKKEKKFLNGMEVVKEEYLKKVKE
ncbi:MAG TPA: uracil-DNA glycosylase family protein, partial [Candidatus Hypogeohydataceae bacterium YC40]